MRDPHASAPPHASALPLAFVLLALVAPASGAHAGDDTDGPEEMLTKATGFFGDVSEGLAKAIEKTFRDQGRPNACITGEEGSGALVIGLRYGQGTLERRLPQPHSPALVDPVLRFV